MILFYTSVIAVILCIIAFLVDYAAEGTISRRKRIDTELDLQIKTENGYTQNDINDLRRGHEAIIDKYFNDNLAVIDPAFKPDGTPRDSAISPLPPFIDTEGNLHARAGQLKTDHGVIYEHPLTGRPMLLDLKGDEHDILFELYEREYNWNAVATQGGGSFMTAPLNRADAIEFVCKKGNVAIVYVDDTIKTIMYKQV